MKKRLAFKFYSSYYDVAQELNDNERLAFYDALMKRQFSGVETELKGMAKLAYISQKHSIDKQIEGWESKMKTSLIQQVSEPSIGGKKGGLIGGIKDPSQQEKEEEKEQEKEQEELVVSKRASATPQKKSLIEKRKDREKKFYDELTQYISKFPKETIRAFFDYWSEPNKSGSKMRWEMEKTWDTSRRLSKWSQNEDKWANTERLTETPTSDPKKRNYV